MGASAFERLVVAVLVTLFYITTLTCIFDLEPWSAAASLLTARYLYLEWSHNSGGRARVRAELAAARGLTAEAKAALEELKEFKVHLGQEGDLWQALAAEAQQQQQQHLRRRGGMGERSSQR